MLRRIGVLASLAVMATMFAGVQSASAQTAGVCVFEGLAGTLSPALPNAIPDVQDGNILDIEQGSYVYSGNTAVCAGVFDGAPQAAADVNITSNGYYDNLICGTGFAHDLDGSGTTVNSPSAGISVSGAGYQIPFVAGIGPILIGPSGAPALAGLVAGGHAGASGADANHGAVSSAYTGAGLVQITPGNDADVGPQRDNCITPAAAGNDGNTGSFQVKGFFVAASL